MLLHSREAILYLTGAKPAEMHTMSITRRPTDKFSPCHGSMSHKLPIDVILYYCCWLSSHLACKTCCTNMNTQSESGNDEVTTKAGEWLMMLVFQVITFVGSLTEHLSMPPPRSTKLHNFTLGIYF